MRILKIRRPKDMKASLSKLIVEIDGEKVDKLANGQEITATIDERAHELYIHGGKLAGKEFSTKLMIPAGGFSYTFQTDMMEVNTKYGSSIYKPVLLPCGDTPRTEVSRVVQLMAATLTAMLLDQKLRDILIKIPEARLKLVLGQQEWGLVACVGTERKTLTTQPYSHRKGSLLAAVTNTIEHGDLQTPEGREKLTDMIFSEYLKYLPDYQLGDGFELKLKSTP